MRLRSIKARLKIFRAQSREYAARAAALHREADDYARARGRGGYIPARRRANACERASKGAAEEVARLLSLSQPVKLAPGRYKVGRYEANRIAVDQWEIWQGNTILESKPSLTEAIEEIHRMETDGNGKGKSRR